MSNMARRPYLLLVERRISYLLTIQSGCIFKQRTCQDLSPFPLRRIYPAKQDNFSVLHLERIAYLIDPGIALFQGSRHFPAPEPGLDAIDQSKPVQITG